MLPETSPAAGPFPEDQFDAFPVRHLALQVGARTATAAQPTLLRQLCHDAVSRLVADTEAPNHGTVGKERLPRPVVALTQTAEQLGFDLRNPFRVPGSHGWTTYHITFSFCRYD